MTDGMTGDVTRSVSVKDGMTTSARPEERFAVIDIGSNSLRLVVYQSVTRAPRVLFNEKILCGLGRGVASKGYMHPEGVNAALAHLVRFRALIDAMGAGDIAVLATAAVRDAANGPEFVEAVRQTSGFAVQIVSGDEEARLSALGVLSATPNADGIVGDLGGGSLELVKVAGRATGDHATLPLGSLRLMDAAAGSLHHAGAIIDRHLDKVDWLNASLGRNFYAVGGAWRLLARLFMALDDYPLPIIHHYRLAGEQVMALLKCTAQLDHAALKAFPNLPRRRLDSLPWASLVLEHLFERLQPQALVFSAFGLREGCLFERLPAAERQQDPLLAGCHSLTGASRFQLDPQELLAFMTPVLATQDDMVRRLAHAACILSDIAWSDHPDHRALQAYHRVLFAPLIDIDHAQHVFLTLSLSARYGAPTTALPDHKLLKLLPLGWAKLAGEIGVMLRLGYILSGAVPGLLPRAWLGPDSQKLILRLPADGSMIAGKAVVRHLEALGRSLELPVEIVTAA